MKKQTEEDRLIKKYGAEIVNEAVEHFIRIGNHCTILELEEMCIKLKDRK